MLFSPLVVRETSCVVFGNVVVAQCHLNPKRRHVLGTNGHQDDC